MIIAILEVRGLPLDSEHEARVRGCDSLESLQGWARRAREVEGVAGAPIFPEWLDLGVGIYADDLGVNVYGLLVCTAGYLLGAVPFTRS